MEQPSSPGHDWTPLDYDQAWASFNARFDFKPDYYERTKPAISVPIDAVVIDLAPVYQKGPRFAAGQASVNASALRAFVWVYGDKNLTALEWQSTPYKYSPARHALSGVQEWPVPVFPNGDYYGHLTADAIAGTFGHPWHQTLTIWGSDLVDTLGRELLTWLPRHPQSPTTSSV